MVIPETVPDGRLICQRGASAPPGSALFWNFLSIKGPTEKLGSICGDTQPFRKAQAKGRKGLVSSQCWEGEKDIILIHKAVYMKNISIFSRLSHSWFEIGNACEKHQGGFYCKPFQIPSYRCCKGPSKRGLISWSA